MSKKKTQDKDEGFALSSNPVYTWECLLFGARSREDGITWNVDRPPNWFWRLMQFIIFGNRWRRIKDE